jgi:hypothetical protein
MEIVDTALGPVLQVPIVEFVGAMAAKIGIWADGTDEDGTLLTNLTGFCGELLIRADGATIIHENMQIKLPGGRHIVNFEAVNTGIEIIPAVSGRIIHIPAPFQTYLQRIADQIVLVAVGCIYNYYSVNTVPHTQFYGLYTTSEIRTGYYHGTIHAINATIVREDPEFRALIHKCDESAILPIVVDRVYTPPQLYIVVDTVKIYQFRNWIFKKYGIIFQGAPLTTTIVTDRRTQQIEDLKMRQASIQKVMDRGLFIKFVPTNCADIGAF